MLNIRWRYIFSTKYIDFFVLLRESLSIHTLEYYNESQCAHHPASIIIKLIITLVLSILQPTFLCQDLSFCYNEARNS